MKDFTHPLKELWMEPKPSRLLLFGKFLRHNWLRCTPLCVMLGIIVGVGVFKLYPQKPESIPWEQTWRDTEHDEDVIYIVSDSNSGGIIITTNRTAADAIQLTATAGGIDIISREDRDLIIEGEKE